MQHGSNPFRVDGQVALVTGAAQGIGASSARLLAKAGASVLVTDIETDLAEQVAGDIEKTAGTATACHLDVVDEG